MPMNEIENLSEIPSFSSLINGLKSNFTVEHFPTDVKLHEAKYCIVTTLIEPKIKLCIQNKISDLNKSFFSNAPDKWLKIRPARQLIFGDANAGIKSDDIVVSLGYNEQDQLKKLVQNGYLITLFEGKPMSDGETRPGPRNQVRIEAVDNETLVKKTLSEDEIQEYYLGIIRYLFLLETPENSISNEKGDFGNLNKLIESLELLSDPQINLDEKTLEELSKKIKSLQEAIKSTDKGFISKLLAFGGQSWKQFKRIQEATKKLEKLKELLKDEQDQKTNLNFSQTKIWTFWLTKVFFPNVGNFLNWKSGQFNFFQGQYASVVQDGDSTQIILNYLEPFRTLPLYTSLLRVAMDGFKTFSKETLQNTDLDAEIKNRKERLGVFLDSLKSLPVIEKKQLEITINYVLFMTVTDLIIDTVNELGDSEKWFAGIPNGAENYKKSALACIAVLREELKI
jgi:hypothetical protein